MAMRRFLLFAVLAIAVSFQSGVKGQGELLWEDVVNLGFFRTDGDIAGMENGRIYAVINGNFTDSPSSNARVMTHAYDAKTGVVLWTDTWNVSPSDDSGRGAVTDDVVLVAASTMLNSTEAIATYSVRAFDGRSGTVLWSDECGPGNFFNTGARNVIASSHLFFVAGDCQGRGFVRAYEAGTGIVVWEVEASPFGVLGPGLPAMTAAGSSLLFADLESGGSSLVRSVDVRTGEILWVSDPLPSAGTSGILAAGGLVTVSAGSVIRGLDATSGQTLWDVNFGDVAELPRLISLKANRLALTVRFSFDADSVVRVYDARNGTLISEGPNTLLPGTVKGNQRYVAGSRIPLVPPMGMREFFIQAFDAMPGPRAGKQAGRSHPMRPMALPD